MCRAASAGGVLPPEQPDGPVNAGLGSVGGPCLRRQGGRLRHAWHHDRWHGPRGDRLGVCLGRRARTRGPRARLDRDRVHAHVRSRAPRRHAVSGAGPAAELGVPVGDRRRLCRSGRVRVLGGARPARHLCRSPRKGRARVGRRRAAVEGRDGSARRGTSKTGHRRALAGSVLRWRRCLRRRGASPPCGGVDREASRCRALPAVARRRVGAAVRQGGTYVPGGHRPRSCGCLARRSAGIHLRRGRRRHVRQRLLAAATAARGVRRSHPELTPGRRGGAGRLRGGCARGAATDR